MRGYGIVTINNPGWIEAPKPTPGPLDAILRPRYLSPCSSDTHSLHGGSGDKKDMILGHEAVGEIVEVGKEVKDFKVGDVVAVPCTSPNWLLPGVQNKVSFSHDSGPMGSFKFNITQHGTMAEFFLVKQADANLAVIPQGVSPEAALMTVDMMSTGFYGAEMTNISMGDTVVVIGIGPVGLMAVAGAAIMGAGRIIAIGTRPNCVKIAREFGATDIVSYKDGDLVKQVRDLTGGKGAEGVVIAGGKQETFGQAIQMCRETGTVANVNYFDVKDVLSFKSYEWGLGMADISIRGGFCPAGRVRIEKLMQLIKYGRVDPAKMITHTYKGFDKIEEAFLIMDKKPADLIKPVVVID